MLGQCASSHLPAALLQQGWAGSTHGSAQAHAARCFSGRCAVRDDRELGRHHFGCRAGRGSSAGLACRMGGGASIGVHRLVWRARQQAVAHPRPLPSGHSPALPA